MSKTTTTIETLHTCPDCGQENFTAKGLKAHQGKKACTDRQKQKATELANAHPEVAACATRFAIIHGYTKRSVEMLKLLKYFGGLEVNAIYALHRELYGETRGGGEAAEVTLQDFVESRLGVTSFTARKYRDFFLSISGPEQHAALATRLNEWWLARSTKMVSQGEGGGAETLSLQELSSITAADLQSLLTAPDEWGLNELFEEPVKDVTPPDNQVNGDPNADDGPSDKDRIIKFWHDQLTKKIASNEYLRLPKAQREALATTLEEAVSKLKATLKPAKKKGAA